MLFSRLLPAAALVLLSGPSLATEPDTIVVTAARTPLSLTETGASVTVITRDDIERRQSRYVSDLLRSVPGFSVSRSGGVGTQTQLRVRGAEANHLLVLINGVQANDPAGGDEARLELLSTAGVERIEIVRGPQSASWGSEAVGGVVNIITRRDVTAGGGSLRAESGSNDTLNVAGEVAGRIGDLALTLAADRLDTDGSNVSRSGEERDGADLSTLSLFADYAPSGPFSAALMLRHAASDSDFDPTDFAVTGLPVDGDLSGEAERNHAGIDLRFGEAGARLGHRVTAGFLDTENRSFSAGAETGVTLAERLQLGYQLDAALGGDTISIGVDREDTDFEQRGPIGFGDPNQRQSLDTTGLYAEYIGRGLEGVTWSLSLRHDSNSEFDDGNSARAMLAWAATGTTRLRFSASRGQKNPTFVERFGFFPGLFSGNAELQPEKSTAVEVGLEQRFFNAALVLDAAVFRQDLTDEINGFVFDPDTFLFTAENGADDSERRGAELGVSAVLGPAADLTASYTYLDATEPDGAGGERDEIRRPRHQGNVTVAYRAFDERLTLNLTADYGGARFDRFFPPFPEPPREVGLGAYWLADLSVRYAVTPALDLTARATNLLDEDYEEVLGFATPGRRLFVGFAARFGETE